MSRGTRSRLRFLILLVAFGIGLAGQVVAAAAMPTAMPMSQAKVGLVGATAGAGGCPSCLKQHKVPGSAALMPGCAASFCSVLPAVLPSGPTVAPRGRVRFSLIAVSDEAGLTICPDLGPPRAIHLS